MATYRRSILFRLAADPIARIWSGFGNLDVLPDAVDPDGARYLGGGALLDVPALRMLVNGTADRLDFTLSGVSPYAQRLAHKDAASVKDALVLIGEQAFNSDWQISAPPAWVWRGYADALVIDSADSDQGRQRTIKLSVRSADARRSDPMFAYYTDPDQRRRSPTDAIFSHVANISQGARRRFGPSA